MVTITGIAVIQRLQRLTTNRFTWCMNSGGLSILLHQLPYRFPGIDVISVFFFVINLVLWISFSVILILRLAWFRRVAYYEIASDIGELTFLPCWAIALMTLTSNVALLASTSWWGGYHFTVVSLVMWWFVMIWNSSLLFWAFITLFRNHDTSASRLPTSIIIPAVSVSTIAVTGATIVAYSNDLPTHFAIPVMILSFHWVGVGILLGLILYVYLFHELLAAGWPPPPATASMFIFVGPMAQSAAALQILGASANKYGRFADVNRGTFLTAEAAPGLEAACVLTALLLSGLGIIFFLLSVAAMLQRAFQRQLTWTPTWNAIIFPSSTLTSSFILFAIEMDSSVYRVVSATMIVLLLLVFLVNIVFTVRRIYHGQLLVVREDWRVKRRLADEHKER